MSISSRRHSYNPEVHFVLDSRISMQNYYRWSIGYPFFVFMLSNLNAYFSYYPNEHTHSTVFKNFIFREKPSLVRVKILVFYYFLFFSRSFFAVRKPFVQSKSDVGIDMHPTAQNEYTFHLFFFFHIHFATTAHVQITPRHCSIFSNSKRKWLHIFLHLLGTILYDIPFSISFRCCNTPFNEADMLRVR